VAAVWRRDAGAFLASSAAFAQPIFAQIGAKALLDEASAATTAGRYVDALAAYAGAVEAAPGHAAAYVLRADLFVSLRHAELAARDYRSAVRINPDDARLQNGLCRNLALANHDLSGALAACGAAVRLAPRDPVVLATRGYLQLRRGAWAKAEADFAAALDLAPASPDEMYGHGPARSIWVRRGRGWMKCRARRSTVPACRWNGEPWLQHDGRCRAGSGGDAGGQALVGVGERMFFSIAAKRSCRWRVAAAWL